MEQQDWGKIDDKQANRQNKAYRKQLLRLRPRLSQKAWQYFWFGFAETGIHDARLIAISAGDGLDRLPRHFGKPNKFRVRAEFLNQDSTLCFIFNYSQIRKFSFNFDAGLGAYFIELSTKKYFFDPKHYMRCRHLDRVLGDELSSVDKSYLRHEFIFASGACIAIEAARISFAQERFQKIKRV